MLRGDRSPNQEFKFPTLDQLSHRLMDNKREVLLVDMGQDVYFQNLLKTAKEALSKYEMIEGRISQLGEIVANHQGGKVEKSKLESFAYAVHITELKMVQQSNVLLLGHLRKGYFYHRALLFKALADRLGLVCVLQRGEYHRAWITVTIQVGDEAKSFLVDLMHQPGKLIPAESLEAIEYQRLVH